MINETVDKTKNPQFRCCYYSQCPTSFCLRSSFFLTMQNNWTNRSNQIVVRIGLIRAVDALRWKKKWYRTSEVERWTHKEANFNLTRNLEWRQNFGVPFSEQDQRAPLDDLGIQHFSLKSGSPILCGKSGFLNRIWLLTKNPFNISENPRQRYFSLRHSSFCSCHQNDERVKCFSPLTDSHSPIFGASRKKSPLMCELHSNNCFRLRSFDCFHFSP